MLKDWVDCLPVTSRRPDPRDSDRRWEQYCREWREYYRFSTPLAALYVVGYIVFALAIRLMDSPAARWPIAIVAGVIVLVLSIIVLRIAIGPNPPRRHS